MRRMSRCSAHRQSTCFPSVPIASASATASTSVTSSPIERDRWTSRSTKSPRSRGTAWGMTSNRSFCRSTPPTRAVRNTNTPVTSPLVVSRGCHRRRRSVAAHARVISGVRCSSPSSTPRRLRIAAILRQLSIQALCTNRDLVLHMPIGIAKSDLITRRRGPGREHPRS